MGLGTSLAFEMGGAMAMGAWLGVLFDRHFGSKPWGMIVGVVAFLTVALVHIIWTLDRLQKNDEESEK